MEAIEAQSDKVIETLQNMAKEEKYKKITDKVPAKYTKRRARVLPTPPATSLQIRHHVR